MRNKNFYLHIGFGKTGSSALQTFFALNTLKLHDLGLDYPENPNTELAKKGLITPGNGPILYGHYLPYPFPGKFIPAFFENLIVKERENCFLRTLDTDNDILYSGEEISNIPPESYAKLVDIVSRHGFNFKIVCYVRPQDEVIISRYTQDVRHNGFKLPIGDFYLKHRDKFNFYSYLQRFLGLIGNDQLIVRLYDKTSFYGGSIFSDFLSSIGISPDLKEFHIPEKLINVNLSPISLEMLRQSRLNTGKDYFLADLLTEVDDSYYTNNKKQHLSLKPLIDDIYIFYKECNDKLNSTFLDISSNKILINKSKYDDDDDIFVLQDSLPSLSSFESKYNDLFELIIAKISKLEYENNTLLARLGRAYIDNGNYEMANTFIDQLLSIDRNRPDANYLIGVIYLKKGEWIKAADHFRYSILLDGKSPEILAGLFDAYMQLNEFNNAKLVLFEGISNMPTNALWVIRLYNLLKVTSCEEIYQTITNVSSDKYSSSLDGLIAHSNLLKVIHKIDIAISNMKDSAKHFSNSPLFHYYLGTFHTIKNENDYAVMCFKKSIEINPNFLESWIELIKILKDNNQINSALQQIDMAERYFKANPQIYLLKTLVLLKAGKTDEAVDSAERTRILAEGNQNILGMIPKFD